MTWFPSRCRRRSSAPGEQLLQRLRHYPDQAVDGQGPQQTSFDAGMAVADGSISSGAASTMWTAVGENTSFLNPIYYPIFYII
jgi:hypothetical protein